MSALKSVDTYVYEPYAISACEIFTYSYAKSDLWWTASSCRLFRENVIYSQHFAGNILSADTSHYLR